MRTPPQQPAAGLIARLLAEPQRFEFFQAVRLLVLWLGEHGVPPRRALERHLRFRNSLALGFPAGQVEALVPQRVEDEPPQFHLTPTFMGLLGAHGALPSHFTERIAAWESSQPDAELAQAPRAFLDIFTTRMLALFYGAWRKYRVEDSVSGPDGGDGFLPLLLALAGFPPGVPHEGVLDAALARYAGVLRQRPASAVVLARVLAQHFGVPVALQEGIGHWDPLAPAEQSMLGGQAGKGGWPGAVLGQAAVLGERCWRPDLRVRVRVGPLRRAQFERFLPQAPGARALRTMLGLFAAPTLSYEVVLVLARSELRPVRLAGGPQRLGRDSFLITAKAAHDRADMVYEMRPMLPLPPTPSAFAPDDFRGDPADGA
ncbi:type VI secretion system baseplate subunit TssG [Massilia sp. LXY-6]|uniref:type VI secretion system baseplate subunit TssG n=1 Tax=Massilia sp. LXY-6 TaxID=3379823 RepID=UPI003EE26A62